MSIVFKGHTVDGWNPAPPGMYRTSVNNGINMDKLSTSTGAGFQPSTVVSPRKINIEPENDGLEDDFPFPRVYSQIPC